MCKLIRSHKECGHRLGTHCLYPLSYDNASTIVDNCIPTGEQNFPDNCPLEQGTPMIEGYMYVKNKPTESLVKVIPVVEEQICICSNGGTWLDGAYDTHCSVCKKRLP